MLAIDINSNNICVVEGKYVKGTLTINNVTKQNVPDGFMVDGLIINSDLTKNMLNGILGSKSIKDNRVTITVASPQIIMREVELPALKDKEFEMLLANEVETMLNSKEYVYDYIINSEKDGKYNVLVFAMPTEVVERYLKILKESNLKPIAFDIHANSITKLLNANIMQAAIGIDSMIFVEGCGQVLNTHLYSEGKLVYTRSIANHNGYPVDSDDYAMMVSNEIEKMAQYLQVKFPQKKVDRVFITGNIASCSDLMLELRTRVYIPLEIISACNAEMLRVSSETVCEYTCAIGALLRL